MRAIVFISLALVAASLVVASGEQQQQQQQQKRVLRRVIKSTPTATNLGRVRLVTVRAVAPAEKGAVSEISSKEAASFGQRSSNETSTQQQQHPAATKSGSQAPVSSKPSSSSSASSLSSSTNTNSRASPTTPATSSTTTSTTTTSTTTTAQPTITTSAPAAVVVVPKASERQQAAPVEVELLSSAPSSWQMMTAVEAPAAALIAAGTRPAVAAQASGDLSSASSSEYSSLNQNDFLRASSGASKTNFASTGQTYSSLRQSAKTKQQHQQQSFFYPQQQQQQLRQGKTSNYQATKTQWYQTTSSTTTPRPAPLVEEPQYEQYVEQQHVDSAPPGQAEPFAFDFNTQDTSGNGQYRKEESDNNGVVRGSYGFRDANGLYRHVEYVADHNGFRANIKSNEPGLEGGRDSQPASIRLDSGPAPARLNSNDNGDWTATSSVGAERANLALAPPDFESSHKAERIRGNF